ncbi:hypothetical protein COV42_00075 [Candidatus Campbellbacteria bacterium CG11_big_fil_rev_8_21_14_0_20_44_21]|uniref:Uncharacterized protein n=1 Tax=Candidatus Campbellbacteria bacterium CG22_combo_CG10-13_8_21_14_all_43_18 TaxID=1974530 RepID=A0A2H0DVS6_9BACT|nr:MAG: hypothetical protein COW82_02835 [Candidatus Campbellbacteria bacterium CG22_combo_CG10-13_8_21_14_all_43_18]PIR24565.1 MAG: hypothetical protein COV42_00075 [Candidatus Campbellbacteria bacterium CG11_big_fil_rev_8_21_14_0_20_44_21]
MWALRKRLIYILGFLAVLAVLFALPIYRSLNKAPTCFDEKQNGAELGIDCGGACEKICQSELDEPIILWSRSVPVRDGLYNFLAMIENPNVGAGALDVPYVFKLFDDENILIYERKGRVDISPQARFPIFEGGIVTAQRKPARTFFEFIGPITWLGKTKSASDLIVKSKELIENGAPRAEAVILNRGSVSLRNIEAFVIVYDDNGNAIAGSKTFIESVAPDEEREITFTWPEPFQGQARRVEIILKPSAR